MTDIPTFLKKQPHVWFFNKYTSGAFAGRLSRSLQTLFGCKKCVCAKKRPTSLCVGCKSPLCKQHRLCVVIDLDFRSVVSCESCFAERAEIFVLNSSLLFDLKTVTETLDAFFQRLVVAKQRFVAVSVRTKETLAFYTNMNKVFMDIEEAYKQSSVKRKNDLSTELVAFRVWLEQEKATFLALFQKVETLHESSKVCLLRFNKEVHNLCVQLCIHNQQPSERPSGSTEKILRLHRKVFSDEKTARKLLEAPDTHLSEKAFLARFCQGKAKRHFLGFSRVEKAVRFIEDYVVVFGENLSLRIKNIEKRRKEMFNLRGTLSRLWEM